MKNAHEIYDPAWMISETSSDMRHNIHIDYNNSTTEYTPIVECVIKWISLGGGADPKRA